MSLCKKCGSVEYSVKWDPEEDMLDFECKTCGFRWEQLPLDSMERAKKEMKSGWMKRPAVGKTEVQK